ncbi:MAG: VOC family protein [Amphritea sp.]|nr:VOC family protein [Amphritea sp.]
MQLQNNTINYVEFPARDLEQSKAFFSQVFGWSFTDFGEEYTAFDQQGIQGGFFKVDLTSDTRTGAALIVLYHDDLESIQVKVEAAGGIICKPIFSFPGGRRFHFTEPSGNELAVWSDQGI